MKKLLKRQADFAEGTDLTFQRDDVRRDYLLYNVTQLGYVSCKSGYSMEREGYNGFALFYVTGGRAQLEYDGRLYRAEKNSLIYFDQRLHNRISCLEAPLSMYYVYLYGSDSVRFFQRFNEVHGCVYNNFDGVFFTEAVASLRDSIKRGDDNAYKVSVEVYSILMDVLAQSCGNNTGLVRDAAVERVIELISHEFPSELTLDDLAREACYSKYYFIRRFKECTGYTPKEYLDAVRFEKSRVLLCDGSLTLSQVIERTGFADRRAFNAYCRKKTGLTAAKYRRFVALPGSAD